MTGAGNPLGYDYRDPRHVERYRKLVVRNPDGSTEGKHPRDADVDVLWRIRERGAQMHRHRVRPVAVPNGEQSVPRST
jgi:hypothetical protein